MIFYDIQYYVDHDILIIDHDILILDNGVLIIDYNIHYSLHTSCLDFAVPVFGVLFSTFIAEIDYKRSKGKFMINI